MTTQSSNVLKMLKDIAAKEVELAAEALAMAMKVLEEAQSKQDLLRDYRQGYVESLSKSLEVGIGVEAYQNFKDFFGKLDQAITGQEEVIASAKQQIKIQRGLWLESQRKKRSFEVLSERTYIRQLKIEQKKDQKMTDEFAMRIGRTGYS